MNLRDRRTMWRPEAARKAKPRDKERATWSSSSESESISSSTSSSSSSTSQDDEQTIAMIRRIEKKHEGRAGRFGEGEEDSGLVKEILGANFPNPWVHYDQEIARINEEVRNL